MISPETNKSADQATVIPPEEISHLDESLKNVWLDYVLHHQDHIRDLELAKEELITTGQSRYGFSNLDSIQNEIEYHTGLLNDAHEIDLRDDEAVHQLKLQLRKVANKKTSDEKAEIAA